MAEPERRHEKGDLFDQVSALIEETRAVVAAQVNAALTLANPRIGRPNNSDALGKQRAGCGEGMWQCSSPQLTKRYGG